jgi:biotin carboxylase
LWANTILFDSHPLQQSKLLDKDASNIRVVGQPPRLVEQYDDKNYVNNLLRRTGGFSMPRSWTVTSADDQVLPNLPFPVVAKPIRGRGSHGVKLCHTLAELQAHLKYLISESPEVMIEDYLAGEESTVTVMPRSERQPHYWTLPVVSRFNHEDGVAPYNGTVAVISNSRVIGNEEFDSDMAYHEVCQQCVRAAETLRVTAPIRIDVRRYKKGSGFALFDVNMKPVRWDCQVGISKLTSCRT